MKVDYKKGKQKSKQKSGPIQLIKGDGRQKKTKLSLSMSTKVNYMYSTNNLSPGTTTYSIYITTST